MKMVRLIVVVTLLSFILLEVVFRIADPITSGFTYKNYQTLNNLISQPERLYPANFHQEYEIANLYIGATKAILNISDNRLIEPQPIPEDGELKVLFLGGSTTESLYVPETQRWVSLINDHPQIATFNAGMSGANIIDKTNSYRYLIEQGLEFDLVVVMTAVNDYAWMRRFSAIDYDFEQATYQDALATFYASDNPLHQSRLYTKLESLLERTQPALSLVDQYIAKSDFDESIYTVDDCDLQEILTKFEQYEHQNIEALYEEVSSNGAELLVLSEATSFRAPPESFIHYLYTGVPCLSDKKLNPENSSLLFEELNRIYLEQGEAVGALTFDLAGQVEVYSDSEDGGQYMYDSVHYTPVGTQLVADILTPILLDIQLSG